jgi:ribonuclease P protein component
MERLKRRADFLAAASGSKVPAAGFVLQARARDGEGPARVGFTVTKRAGNAVERNRIRRRLREIVRLTGGVEMKTGHDYVLIGRRDALTLSFTRMTDDFLRALKRAHARHTNSKPGGKA